MLLEAHGFDVNVAVSGADALCKMNGTSHELVISDCAMPGMSGVELSERLKADPLTAQVPILLMSASRRCDIAKSASYDSFIKKPFLAENLLVEVHKLLNRASVRPNNFSKV